MTPDAGDHSTIARLRSRRAGFDTTNPYADIDITALPDWWQHAIEEHRQYGLRPYRPPRFDDGELKHEIVEALEERHDIEIQFIDTNANPDGPANTWELRVEGECIGHVQYRRSPEGHSVVRMASTEFIDYVETRVATDQERT